MKKWLSGLLAASMLLTLGACERGKAESSPPAAPLAEVRRTRGIRSL